LQGACKASGVDYVDVDTSTPLDGLLARYLIERRRRA